MLRKHLSSIKVKLFLWFWLVTICSISITRFISIQLNEEYISVKPHLKDLRRLHTFVRNIEQDQTLNLAELIDSQRRNERATWRLKPFIFKSIDDNSVLSNLGRDSSSVDAFIQRNTFHQKQSWLFKFYRITGPVEMNYRGKDYLVFYHARAERPKDFRMRFSELPIWIRFGIPLLVSILFCWLLARSLSKPLSNIANVANQFGDGQLSARLDKDAHRNDELGDLAKSFNRMASQLQNNINAHQRLVGDVSHELRSPLTRLQMALALAQKNQHDSEALSSYFQRCELEVERLDTMIEHVLTLSKLENSALTLNKQPTHLTSFFTPIIDDGNFLGQKHNVKVALAANSDPTVTVDQALIASAVSNIINNAVKYSPEDGQVTVMISETATQILINISDQGVGVPEHLLSKLFEPFYRVADARDRASGGTGLGLAIAKQAVIAHQGSISATNQITGGLAVTIALPK